MTKCPSLDDLIGFTADESAVEAIGVRSHLDHCDACFTEVRRIREAATWLRSLSIVQRPSDRACLGDSEIAELIDGRGFEFNGSAVSHLIECAGCRHRLAIVTEILAHPSVVAKSRGLESRPVRNRRVLVSAAGATALAAAFLAGVWLIPGKRSGARLTDPASPAHRESAITTTVAPLIVGPGVNASPLDTLRWTRVPHADQYQVKMFDRAGTLVWNPRTEDTLLAIPRVLKQSRPTEYVWKVEARTGWDRWVASEWSELTLHPRNEQP